MAAQIQPLTPMAATYVSAYIRDSDRHELAAFHPNASVEELAYALSIAPGCHYSAAINGVPAFVFGVVVHPWAPHVGTAWGFGTRHTRKAIPAITDFVRTALIPELEECGLQRVEVRTLETHTSSLAWLAGRLGAKRECALQGAGAGGQTFVQLAWISNVRISEQ